jgi:hypothetical protein
MISDPTYVIDILILPEKYKEEVKLACDLTEQQIGHSDSVEALFSPFEIINAMDKIGFGLQYYNAHPKQDLLNEMRKHKGFEGLARSPIEMFVSIFK